MQMHWFSLPWGSLSVTLFVFRIFIWLVDKAYALQNTFTKFLLFLSHTHTHMHAPTHTHAHTHNTTRHTTRHNTHVHMHTHKDAHTHTHTHMHGERETFSTCVCACLFLSLSPSLSLSQLASLGTLASSLSVSNQFRYFAGLQQSWHLLWLIHCTTIHMYYRMFTGRNNKVPMQSSM